MEAPGAIPVTMPVREPIVAAEVLLLLHKPPLILSVSVVICPAQTAAGPETATGEGLTFTELVTAQPVGSV